MPYWKKFLQLLGLLHFNFHKFRRNQYGVIGTTILFVHFDLSKNSSHLFVLTTSNVILEFLKFFKMRIKEKKCCLYQFSTDFQVLEFSECETHLIGVTTINIIL